MARINKEMGFSDTSLGLLRQNNILTITDFLQEDLEKLSSICNSPFKEVLEIRQNMITNFSALPLNGTYAYQNLLSNSALIPSGIDSLDKLLQGGFLTGSVLEVCGLSGEGKTQLCLTISANVASSLKQSVRYIDTKGDLSAQRLKGIMQQRNINNEDCSSALDRIYVSREHNIYGVIRFLHNLKTSLTEDESSPPRVIIIDSIPALYFPFMGSADISQGFGLLNHLMCTMKVMATEFHILFIVVNLATTFLETEAGGDVGLEEESKEIVNEVRPMLGKYWLHAPNTRLLVTRFNPEAPQRLIRVVKSTYLPFGANCVVCVHQQGVV